MATYYKVLFIGLKQLIVLFSSLFKTVICQQYLLFVTNHIKSSSLPKWSTFTLNVIDVAD